MTAARRFAPEAQVDLDDAVGWLLDHGAAPGGAERMLASVLSAASLLSRRPPLGLRGPELLPAPFRFCHSRVEAASCLVSGPVPPTILQVLNTAQDLPTLLADLRDTPGRSQPLIGAHPPLPKGDSLTPLSIGTQTRILQRLRQDCDGTTEILANPTLHRDHADQIHLPLLKLGSEVDVAVLCNVAGASERKSDRSRTPALHISKRSVRPGLSSWD